MKSNSVSSVADLPIGQLPPSTPTSNAKPLVISEKFGSAEKTMEEEVADDIAECDRLTGDDDFFGSQEEKMRKRLPPAFKACVRAHADPLYCRVLKQKLLDESGGRYRPSEKKPWVLAARMALKPKTKAAESSTYDATYFYRRALIEHVPIEHFGKWIDGRNLKEDRDFVRARNKPSDDTSANDAPLKKVAYPNHAKARSLKRDAEVQKILKVSKDLAEEELAKLFADRESAQLAHAIAA